MVSSADAVFLLLGDLYSDDAVFSLLGGLYSDDAVFLLLGGVSQLFRRDDGEERPVSHPILLRLQVVSCAKFTLK